MHYRSCQLPCTSLTRRKVQHRRTDSDPDPDPVLEVAAMDTPSSGSSSKSTIPSEQGQQASRQTTYTTVGSIFNPEVASQLPAPAQRGRAKRCPPIVSDDIAALDQFVQANAPYEQRQPTPPSTATIMKEYSPLQQNRERAADPVAALTFQERIATEALMNMSKPTTPFHEGPPRDKHIRTPQDQVTPVRGGGNASGHDDQWSGNMRHHSVKALTNLASYPNRHQQAAQRVLDRGRKSARPTPTGPAAHRGRPVTPAYHMQNASGPGGQYSSPSSSSPWGLRDHNDYNHNDHHPAHGHINNTSQPGGCSGGYGAPRPLTAGPPGQRQYKAATLEGPYRALQTLPPVPPLPVDESHFDINPEELVDLAAMVRSPEYPMKPVAATMPQPSSTHQHMMPPRPGLLQPGKAPPGMSQPHMPQPGMHQPTIPLPGVPQTTGPPPGLPHPAAHQTTTSQPGTFQPAMPQPASRPSSFQCGHGYEDIKQRSWTTPLRESRVADRVKQYYNGDTPPGYNPLTCIDAPEDNSDLMSQLRSACSRRQQVTEEERRRRDARHRVAFYAGTAEMTKTWDERFEELRQRVRNKELGASDAATREAAIDAALKCDTIGKPNDFNIEIFNDWPTHEVIEPLLGMAYSALGRYLCDSGRLSSMQQEVKDTQRPEDDEMWACTRGSDPFMTPPGHGRPQQAQQTSTNPPQNNKTYQPRNGPVNF
ncbi:hypothetical protein M406DRAFT_71467 [Cryphonectria parasitica EP155]|uniref:Uncharacterized protein n=1 Tax=Cryphonectria parasitica (strain ATCC 38755 / EP155) TaxID=660469 RepID=A0A9P4Y8U0_CRYP1|nr:uncharacterized protein M406DRAFT_71467 [Cryphonectria parasitica EP155]KAF3768462.1 hypothetical protein M406DRAFT_71467 [Cryphonectria parasitica EP155]